MPADRPSGEGSSIPSEVPEEFAAAYQAAFEEALRAQAMSAPGAHVDRSTARRSAVARIPRASRPRAEVRAEAPADVPADVPAAVPDEVRAEVRAEPTTYERVRDSRWFVPVLLLVLALVLLAGTYLLGRQFATHVGAGSHSVGQRASGLDLLG